MGREASESYLLDKHIIVIGSFGTIQSLIDATAHSEDMANT